MNTYRCVFNYAGGNTTIEVSASSGEDAVEVAAIAISAGDYDRVDVWDGDQLLLTRTTARAWGQLGDAPAVPASGSHPRRISGTLTAGLKGVAGGQIRGPRKASRKG